MQFELGEVIHKEDAPVEVRVKFWDDTKSVPHDVIEAMIFLKTDETNIFILKTMALMKAQELIIHIAGVALGKEDELLNDFIFMRESLKKIPGVEFPLAGPLSLPTPDIPEHLLAWREGDKITKEHRDLLTSRIAHTFNLSPEKEAENREKSASISDENIASLLAVVIASETGMSVDTFKRTFPTIARDSQSLAVKVFLAQEKKSSDPTGE
jgi:hypothetical protein